MMRLLLAALLCAGPAGAAPRAAVPPRPEVRPATPLRASAAALPFSAETRAAGPRAASADAARPESAMAELQAAANLIVQAPAMAVFVSENFIEPVGTAPLYHRALRSISDSAGAGRGRGRHRALRRLIEGGFWGRSTLEPSAAGRRVVSVDPRSPAADAVFPGDQVIADDGARIRLRRPSTRHEDLELDARGIHAWAVANQLVAAIQRLAPDRPQQAALAALKALVGGLDRYSEYMTPAEYERMIGEMRGRFAGVGLTLSGRPESGIRIMAVERRSAAARAGVRAGDVLRAVDGAPVDFDDGRGLRMAGDLIRGAPGTSVTLSLERDGATLQLSVTRELRKTPLVHGELRPGAVGYLQLSAFAADAAAQLRRRADALKRRGARSLLLDLRFNGGGDARVAGEAAGVLLGPERVVATFERRGRAQQLVTPDEAGGPVGLPLVVLVNRFTASSAEILAAALRDHAGALLVGEETFGKGVGQSIVPLDEGRAGALKATTFRWRSLRGEVLAPGAGIKPAVEVRLDDESSQRAYAALAGRLAGAKGMPEDPALARGLAEARRLASRR